MKKIGFQRKLSISLVSMSLGGMLICGGASYYFISRILKNEVYDSLSNRVNNIQSTVQIALDSAISRQDKVMENWAAQNSNKISVDASELTHWNVENQADHSVVDVDIPSFKVDGKPISDHKLVDQFARETGNAMTFFALTPQGLVRVSTSLIKKDGTRGIKTFIPRDSQVVKSIIEGKRYTGLAPVLGEIYITAYEPIYKDKKVVGAVFLGSPEIAVEKLKEHLKEQKILQTGYFYILDNTGTFVLHPAKQGENVLASMDLDGRPIFKQILNMKHGMLEYRWLNASTKKPQDKIAVFHFFPELNWTIAASLNSDEAFAPLIDMQKAMSGIVASLTFLMVIVSLLLGRPMAQQLEKVEGQLSSSVESNSHDSASANSVSQSLAGAVAQQATALQETAAAVEEIRATLSMNLTVTEKAREASDHLAAASEKGRDSLQNLDGAIKDINTTNGQVSRQIDESFNEISRILDLISEIESKTNMINEIVLQTKLLSFNASVEAAHAGEAGKGFAVVAQEVGRLAAMSGTSAADIQATLQVNRDSVQSIIASAKQKSRLLLNESAEKVSSGVHLTAECKTQFDRMQEDMDRVFKMIQDIATASAEQSKGIEEISRAMLEIETATQESASLAQESSTLVVSLQSNAALLDGASLELKKFLTGLKEEKEAA